ncbi:MAG TPA: transcription elongation factor GreA [Abditibacteriaceae bacterium]|jgi:transcription elongation factor GreA
MSLQTRFTRDAYDRLQNELDSLKGRRAEVINDIKEAREQGDLRENHAYHQAKDTQGMIEARIAELELRLADAQILEEGDVLDEVVLGVPVKVKNLNSGAEREYCVVSPEEMESVDNGASQASPVGSALLGKKVGEVAEVQGPAGIVKFEILSIG